LGYPGSAAVSMIGLDNKRGAAAAVEELNDIVLPGGTRRVGLGVWKDAAVNGLPGIEMRMPASIEVKPVVIQDSPQIRKGNIRRAWRFGGVGGVFAGDIVIGRMNEKEFMGGLGLGHLGIEPA